MNVLSKIEKLALETGFLEFGYVKVENLKYYREVREICEKNACGGYGTSWACPPATGTIAQCRERVAKYDKMLLFAQTYRLEDSFDYEGMIAGAHAFKELMDRFKQKLDKVMSGYLLLGNEGCHRCSPCTYPDAPCRFPELLYHPLEGYGFIVSELSKEAGIRYNNGPDTVTYFGALLFNAE